MILRKQAQEQEIQKDRKEFPLLINSENWSRFIWGIAIIARPHIRIQASFNRGERRKHVSDNGEDENHHHGNVSHFDRSSSSRTA